MTNSKQTSTSDPQAIIAEVRKQCTAMDRGVGYRVSGDHSTWDQYHEGKSDFAGQIEEVLDAAELPQAFTVDEIQTALNRAADAVTEAAGVLDDDPIADIINLIVNASAHFVEHPHDDLDATIAANYDDPSEEVRSWLQR